MKLGKFFYISGMKVLDYLIKWDYISIKEGGKSDISTHLSYTWLPNPFRSFMNGHTRVRS